MLWLYVSGVCNREGYSGLFEFNLRSLDEFKFDMTMNLVNIVTVVKQETSPRSGKSLSNSEVKIQCVKLPLWL